MFLADGSQLVTQVVPSALLPMSRQLLATHFSFVVPKRIFTFSFDRAVGATNLADVTSLCSKLDLARATCGVVVSTPAALKSLQLRFVETVMRTGEPRRPGDVDPGALCSQLGELLGLLGSGTLVIDEVDLVLHPLRSELNFPISGWADLTPAPDRWDLPINLLDAILCASAMAVAPATGRSRAAAASGPPRGSDDDLIVSLANVFGEGVRRHQLQSVPHLVLLDTDYYGASIAPLLAAWILRFLTRRHKISARTGHSVSSDDMLAYLLRGTGGRAGEGVMALEGRVSSGLAPETVAMLNLGYDWLTAYVPHSLSKINRVSYGLLNAAQIEAGGAGASKSRSLTAVPFVGKDVPSPASEYAHPDVVIGLTILAYVTRSPVRLFVATPRTTHSPNDPVPNAGIATKVCAVET